MLRSVWVWILQCLGFDPRGIFHYHNGRRYCSADPMDLMRRLWAAQVDYREPHSPSVMQPFETEKATALIGSGEGDKIQRGYAIVAEAVHQVFSVDSLENGGLTEEECLSLLVRFEQYLGDLKKNINVRQTTHTVTDSNSVDVSDSESATNRESPSTFTSTGTAYAMPDTSVLEPQLVAIHPSHS